MIHLNIPSNDKEGKKNKKNKKKKNEFGHGELHKAVILNEEKSVIK